MVSTKFSNIVLDNQEDYKVLPITKGLFVKVSLEDFDRLTQYKWYANPSADKTRYYARGSYEGELVYMHRVILSAPRELEVDHINGDSLDNRRSNLRLATDTENNRNCKVKSTRTSQYKGVHWCSSTGTSRTRHWAAAITINYKSMSLGHYKTEVDAAKAYDSAALYYFGEFAKTNFQDAIALPIETILRNKRALAGKSSIYKGVAFLQFGVWRAQYTLPGKRKTKHIGRFTTEIEAAKAYDRKVIEVYGNQVRTNFPIEEYLCLESLPLT